MFTVLRPALLCATAALMNACGSADSPEAQVRQVIDQMKVAAEERDVGDLMEFVSPDFRDAYGQGGEELARYIRGYFIANQSIHLLTRINQIEFPLADEARLQVTVGMAGREADAAATWNLATDLQELDVTLRKEAGTWKVTYAKWSRE